MVFGLAARPAYAHVKWFFEDEAYQLRWDLFFQPLPLLFVGGVLLATVTAGVLWLRRGRSYVPGPGALGATDERQSLLYAFVPLILGIHVAVPLLVNGVQGTLFSPDNELPGAWANFLGLAQTGVALSLFYGGLTRIAAVVLAALWGMGLFVVGLEPMLDNVFFLGFAAFFFLAGRGPVSVDRMLFPRLEPPVDLARYAVPAVRIGVGLSLAVVAFTEKFANLPMATGFLAESGLNFTPYLGVPLSDELFVLAAGSVELVVGLWLVLGVFVREIVIIAWFPTNLTLTLFFWEELIGHLPIYGVMAVLLVWGAGSKNISLWLRGLRERMLPVPGPEPPDAGR
ncbi:MAG: DoxX protein [Rubrobacter sp.]|nr:DoxX protein [Rubrobacter sp.]